MSRGTGGHRLVLLRTQENPRKTKRLKTVSMRCECIPLIQVLVHPVRIHNTHPLPNNERVYTSARGYYDVT